VASAVRLLSSTDDEATTSSAPVAEEHTPWNRPPQENAPKRNTRFRQHVNPLSKLYQMETPLSEAWPTDVFEDMPRSLHLDIGCSKGGFLLDLAAKQPGKNYLGLEIRPSVAEYAQERVAKHDLTGALNFVGCNANVDLDRILTRYDNAGGGSIDIVSIQFPDPHFKTQHAKRRVVTPSLVETLAKFMPPSAVIFLQSDIQDVLDDMREKFREYDLYFQDEIESVEEYMPENFIGVPTEREISVLDKDLPVFRTILRRTAAAYQEPEEGEEQ
jgi:tRNA (guanine-N7-)-methyltransferase